MNPAAKRPATFLFLLLAFWGLSVSVFHDFLIYETDPCPVHLATVHNDTASPSQGEHRCHSAHAAFHAVCLLPENVGLPVGEQTFFARVDVAGEPALPAADPFLRPPIA